MAKNNDLQNTTQKTKKDRATQTPQKSGGTQVLRKSLQFPYKINILLKQFALHIGLLLQFSLYSLNHHQLRYYILQSTDNKSCFLVDSLKMTVEMFGITPGITDHSVFDLPSICVSV